MLRHDPHRLTHISIAGMSAEQNRQVRQLHLDHARATIAMHMSRPVIARVNHHLKTILSNERRHESDNTDRAGLVQGFLAPKSLTSR